MRRTCQKFDTYSFRSKSFSPEINLIFLKPILYWNIRLGEHILLKSFSISFIFKKTYLVKLCPIFDGSASSCLTRHKKSFEGVHWGARPCWILPASLWNQTTVTTLMYMPWGIRLIKISKEMPELVIFDIWQTFLLRLLFFRQVCSFTFLHIFLF